MKTLSDRIRALTTDNLEQLIEDYEQFERDGAIGDCYLRSTAKEFAESLGIQVSGVLWMDRVAFEAYRELFYRVLQDLPYECSGSGYTV